MIIYYLYEVVKIVSRTGNGRGPLWRGQRFGTAYGTSEQLFLFHMSNAQAQAEALERSVTLQIEKGGTTAAASADIDRKNTSG